MLKQPILNQLAWIFLCLVACNLFSCSHKSDSQALGTLERDRILLKATASELVTARPVLEGAMVQEKDLLLQLDDTNQKLIVARAKATLASAKANLLKLHHGARAEDVGGARAQVARAESIKIEMQKSYERISVLIEKKLVGQADLDAARAKRDSANADFDRAKQNLLLLTNGTRLEDIQLAEAQVEQAEATYKLEQQHLSELSIRATRSGKLDRLPKYLGERVTQGETVAVILASAAPYARVYIPETQRVNVTAGKSFNLHADGKKEVITGKVRWVSQEPAFTPYYALNSSDRTRLVYLAEIQLPNSESDLPSGLPVQVDLNTQADLE